MKISNIENKYLRRLTYWLAMPLVYILMGVLMPIALTFTAIAGAIFAVQYEYNRHWKGTMCGPWDARKRM